MSNRLLIVAVTILIVTPIGLTRELTLPQAFQLAWQHSFTLKQSRAMIASTEEETEAAQRNRWPTLSIQSTAFYLDDVPTLDIPLPTGQTIRRAIASNDNVQTDVRLSLPLYTGGRIAAGLGLSQAVMHQAQATAAADSDRVALNVRTAWYSLRLAADDTAAVAASLQRARVILEDVTNRFNAGAADSVDVLQAQLAVTNAELNLRSKQTSLATRRIALSVLLGLPVDEPIIPVDTIAEPVLPPSPASVRADKPEFRSIAAAISQQQWQLRQRRAYYLPSLSVYTGYSYGKPNLDRFNQTWSDYFTVGASLQWSFNLGGKTSHEVSSRNYRLQALQYQRDDLNDRLTREARIAHEQLKLALERYRTAKKQVNIAEANYRLALAQYEAGSITTNRLLEIEAALTSAQASLAAGLATYYLAESNWLFAIGAPELRGE